VWPGDFFFFFKFEEVPLLLSIDLVGCFFSPQSHVWVSWQLIKKAKGKWLKVGFHQSFVIFQLLSVLFLTYLLCGGWWLSTTGVLILITALKHNNRLWLHDAGSSTSEIIKGTISISRLLSPHGSLWKHFHIGVVCKIASGYF
jgi:hypothetical protein